MATGGTSNDPSAPITAGRVRMFLGGLTQDPPGPADAALWEVLSSKGALGGSPDRPQLTDIGRQVLRELSIRAYRADGLSLDQAAQEVGQGISTLAAMSDTAQYFLSELGPLPPVEVVPLMRLAAAHLAVRHESPEDLVQEFKNGWGEAEVLGGPPADRLLAAELLTGSGVPQSEIYSAMTRTSETLRDVGCSAAVATAAILHLFPEPNQTPALERWTAIRKSVPSDEGAALLAGLPHPDATLERWRSYLAALSDTDSPDAQRAAIYLTAIRSSLDTQLIAATRAASSRFAPSIASPLLAAALAVSHLGLSPEESFDWQEKSVAQARAHQLAPDGPELAALGLALLEGLDPASFQGRPVTASAISDAAEGVLARTAVHAWIYRHLVRAPPAVARN